MKTYNFEFTTKELFKNDISGIDFFDKEVFIQVFSGVIDKNELRNLTKYISKLIPNAKIIGSTTDGEILNGKVKKNSIVVSVSVFEKTKVETLLIDKLEKYNSLEILQKIEQNLIKKDTKCLIVFCDWISSIESIFALIFKKYPHIYVSGGKAGDNYNFINPYIFDNNSITSNGMVIASFSGKDLNVYTNYNFSWSKIGKKIQVTKAEGKRIYELDHKPVFEVYEKYLGKIIADQLPKSGMQFPLIINKNGMGIARDVLQKYDDGSLLLAGGIKTGDIVNFGCGNTDDILSGIFNIINDISDVPIESVFLYSCTARKKFLGKDVIDEIIPISKIYNISGFFTYGEFFHTNTGNEVLNETLTFLCFSESKTINLEQLEKTKKVMKNIRIKSDRDRNSFFALSNLVKVTNQELNEANHELLEWNRNLEEKILKTTKKIKSNREKYFEGYKGIIDNMNEMICIIDKNRMITYANKQFLNNIGYGLEELVKFHIEDLFLLDIKKIQNLSEFNCENQKLTIITKNNKTIPVIVTKLGFIQEGYTLIIKNLQEIIELKESYKKLKELDKKKDEFLNIASHELRTPMTTIKGYLSMVLDGDIGKIDENAKSYLSKIYKDVQRLIYLINDMLDISKIEAGKMEFNIDYINVNKLLEHTILDMQLNGREKNIEVIGKIEYKELFIYSDVQRLRQVLINILGNAIKFTNMNGKIEVISFVLNKNLIIIIKDNGIGIAKEDLSRIFEKFSQVNNPLTRQTGGTGLGLPISLDIIKKLKGKLEVESELGIGTSFKIILPIVNK